MQGTLTYPANLPSDESPQHDVYLIGHVSRTMERDHMSPGTMSMYADMRSIQFRTNAWDGTSYAVQDPPVQTPFGSFCFFACPPLPKAMPFLHDMFKAMRPRLEQLIVTPSSPGEFASGQMRACESLGHEARIKASVEREPIRRAKLLQRAAFMYEAGLRMVGHATVLSMLNRIARHPDEVYLVRVVADMNNLSLCMKRFISSSFAGMALCALYRDDFARFGSFSSLTVGWDTVGGVLLLNAIRVVAMLGGQLDMYLFVTRNVLMPYLVRTGRPAIFEEELRTCIPDNLIGETRDVVSALATRFGKDMPTEGIFIRTSIINGRIVERVCAVCGAINVKLRHCARCKSIYYCGKECQVKHWGVHRAVCV